MLTSILNHLVHIRKDFRTFNANKYLLKELDKLPLNPDKETIKKTHIKKNMVQALKKVADI